MNKRKQLLIWLSTFLFLACAAGQSETWEIDNLKEIGGHDVIVVGNPEVIETELGPAVFFDGEGDMLLVDFNPIAEALAFTVEVVFKPIAC